MTKDLDQAIGTTLISHEIVTKFAMAEELRLVSSKMDRLYNAMASKIPLDEEYHARFSILKSTTEELKKYQKQLKRTCKCKKDNTNTKNQKKTSIGSVTTPKSSWKFLKRLKTYWEGF